MSFDSGSFALTIFNLPQGLPENALERFEQRKAGMLDHVKEEPVIGWVSGRYLLENRIDEETSIRGGHIYVNLRKAERKIPAALLNAICRREELVYMQANNTVTVPSKIKREIKADTLEKNLMKMPPSLSAVPVVVDRASKVMYLGTGSPSQVDNFLAFFLKTFEAEPMQLNVDEMMFRLFQKDGVDLPQLSFTDAFIEEEHTPARDFLTWLWYFSEEESGRISLEQYGDFELMIDGPLTLAFAAEGKGATETTIKKGSPLKSAEAKAALEVGKKLRKAKLVFCRGEDIWSGTFDADKFSFSGVQLPEGEEMEANSRFAERIQFLHIFQIALQEYFKKFVDETTGTGWQELEKKIKKWTEERDSY